MIKALAHVCLKTADLEKTFAFYGDALGMEKRFQFTRQGKVIGYYLSASRNTFIEVFLEGEIAPGAGNRSLHHFCLETENIKGVREALRARAYAPGEIKLGGDHSLQLWVKDPSGVDVEFHQYTAQSSQTSGQDVEVDW